MAGEPTFPTDFLGTIAGLGRQLTNYLPNTQLFDPNPKVIPERTANLTPRSIGEFFLPQSALDVGLMMVPGGKPLKPIGSKAKQFLRRKDYGEAELVPAIKKIESGEVLPGVLGKDVWHLDVLKRYGFPNEPSINRNKIEEGFVDSITGKWLSLEEGAQLGTARAARPGVREMPTESARDRIKTIMAKERQRKVSQYEEALEAERNLKLSDPQRDISRQLLDYEAGMVPAVKTPEGELIVGRMYEDWTHDDAIRRWAKTRGKRGKEFLESETRWKDSGFVDMDTGEFIPLELATPHANLKRADAREFSRLRVRRPKPKPTISVAERQAQLRKSFPGLPEGKDPVVPAIFDRETGQWFAGKPGVDWMHKQLEGAVVKGREKAGFRGIGPIDDGWQNLRTGEFFKRSVFEPGGQNPGERYWRVPVYDD